MTRACLLRALYGGADDQEIAELALECPELPQPESLDRFIRVARQNPAAWRTAAANALSQLFDIEERSRQL